MKRLTVKDVRLSEDRCQLTAAPKRYLGTRSHKRGRRPNADWSSVEATINASRDKQYQRARPSRGAKPKHLGPWVAIDEARYRVDGLYVPRNELHCARCGEAFVQFTRDGGYARYCSERCRRGERPSRAKEPEPKTCEHCGETFTPKRRDARTCSTRCRVGHHRLSPNRRKEPKQ